MSGLVGSSQYFFGDTGFYGYEISQSCRVSEPSTAYLSRAVSSAGNRKTFTFSTWLKRCHTESSALFSSGTSATELTQINIMGDGQLRFRDRTGGDNLKKTTTALLRDLSAWYHIVCGVDLTQASNSNRVKLYINGTLQTLLDDDSTFINRNTYINKSGDNGAVVGKRAYDTASLFDGYLTETHFVDGTQLTADTFGETKEGVWIPKAVTGVTYGTNGFYLKFNQTGTGTASASTIGADSSGNTNHLTSSGFASTDSNLPDSPTNNFATFNSNYNHTGGSLSEGNLKVATGTSEYGPALSTFAQSSGKWYAEFAFTSTSGDTRIGGVRVNTALSTTYDTGNSGSFAYRQNDGDKKIDGTETSYGATWSASDIIGIALNLDDNEVTFYKNNASQGTFSITGGEYFIALSDGDSGAGGNYLVNFGQDSSFAGAKTAQNNADQNGRGDFYYSPPSGYLALCSANLPEPTISPLDGEQPSDYFNTYLFDGTGSSPTAFTGVGFQTDLLWIKRRDNASNGHHIWYDAIRGGTNALRSSTTGAEAQFGDTVITAFGADGFTIQGTDGPNASGYNNVAWNWLGANTTASNSDGSITSTVSANTTAGFSIVSYTGTGSSTTVGHGLGSVPDLLIIKRRNSAREWYVWNSVSAGTGYLYLNDTAALNTDANRNDRIGNGSSYVAPTASLITLGTSGDVNGSSDTYIMYCFRSIEGYSKIGSYTGNGSTDGTFVYTGFSPAWVMVKKSTTTGSWGIFDNKRDPNNVVKGQLYANLSNAESTATEEMDSLSNGFKLRSTGSLSNDDGATVIYMAFAEMPFKYANAR